MPAVPSVRTTNRHEIPTDGVFGVQSTMRNGDLGARKIDTAENGANLPGLVTENLLLTAGEQRAFSIGAGRAEEVVMSHFSRVDSVIGEDH